MRIQSLKRHGKVNHPLGQYLDDLPPHERQQAETLLGRWRIQWGRHTMPFGGSRLVGQPRLATFRRKIEFPMKWRGGTKRKTRRGERRVLKKWG